MKMWEINEMPREELEDVLQDLIEEYQNLRFQHATQQLDNTSRLRTARRDIARVKTVLHEFELNIRSEKKSAEESE